MCVGGGTGHLDMAMALKRLWPSDTAFTRAVLSAHIVNPYEAFSTLQPKGKETGRD